MPHRVSDAPDRQNNQPESEELAHDLEIVQEWESQGLFSPEEVLSRLDSYAQNILSNRLSQLQRDHLEQNLDAICLPDSPDQVDPTAFAEFLVYRNADKADKAIAQFAPILFRMLVYLSNYPFVPPSSSGGEGLTRAGFRRAFIHTITPLARNFAPGESYSRRRTSGDMRRLVFQGLSDFFASHASSTSVDLPTFDEELWSSAARARSLEGMDDDEDEEEPVVNRDEDGDEIYHDIIDVLYATQPERDPSYGDCRRDAFRQVAKGLRWSKPLHLYVVTADVLESALEVNRRLMEVLGHDTADEQVDPLVLSRGGCDFQTFEAHWKTGKDVSINPPGSSPSPPPSFAFLCLIM